MPSEHREIDASAIPCCAEWIRKPCSDFKAWRAIRLVRARGGHGGPMVLFFECSTEVHGWAHIHDGDLRKFAAANTCSKYCTRRQAFRHIEMVAHKEASILYTGAFRAAELTCATGKGNVFAWPEDCGILCQ